MVEKKKEKNQTTRGKKPKAEYTNLPHPQTLKHLDELKKKGLFDPENKEKILKVLMEEIQELEKKVGKPLLKESEPQPDKKRPSRLPHQYPWVDPHMEEDYEDPIEVEDEEE